MEPTLLRPAFCFRMIVPLFAHCATAAAAVAVVYGPLRRFSLFFSPRTGLAVCVCVDVCVGWEEGAAKGARGWGGKRDLECEVVALRCGWLNWAIKMISRGFAISETWYYVGGGGGGGGGSGANKFFGDFGNPFSPGNKVEWMFFSFSFFSFSFFFFFFFVKVGCSSKGIESSRLDPGIVRRRFV